MKTVLITKEGKEQLKKELDYLWKTKRPKITQSVSEAAALGDRSENAEYKEGKRLLREIDRRIRYIVKRLEQIKVVNYSPEQEGKVYFGARVELENEKGEQLRCRIVGSDEINPQKNHISINSPMAKALLGKKHDSEVIVNTPSGKKIWYINKIQYQDFTD